MRLPLLQLSEDQTVTHRYVEERSAVGHGEAFKQEDLVETRTNFLSV